MDPSGDGFGSDMLFWILLGLYLLLGPMWAKVKVFFSKDR